jgi:predicted NBD/HSP70 family sugar kinase
MTSKTNSASSAWDDLQQRLDNLKPAVARFTICDDPDLRARLADAKAEADEAEQVVRSLTKDDEPHRALFEQRAERARAALAQAQAVFDEKAVVLKFTALPRKQVEALQTANPPTEQEEADGADFAMDTFAPALISAASLDGMPIEYARHCLDTWSAADARGLWNAAWGVQHTQRTDLGKG